MQERARRHTERSAKVAKPRSCTASPRAAAAAVASRPCHFGVPTRGRQKEASKYALPDANERPHPCTAGEAAERAASMEPAAQLGPGRGAPARRAPASPSRLPGAPSVAQAWSLRLAGSCPATALPPLVSAPGGVALDRPRPTRTPSAASGQLVKRPSTTPHASARPLVPSQGPQGPQREREREILQRTLQCPQVQVSVNERCISCVKHASRRSSPFSVLQARPPAPEALPTRSSPPATHSTASFLNDFVACNSRLSRK